MPFLPLTKNAEHKTGKWNSERDPRVVRVRGRQKNPTKHPAPASGRAPRGDHGQLLVAPTVMVGGWMDG